MPTLPKMQLSIATDDATERHPLWQYIRSHAASFGPKECFVFFFQTGSGTPQDL